MVKVCDVLLNVECLYRRCCKGDECGRKIFSLKNDDGRVKSESAAVCRSHYITNSQLSE